MIVRKQNNCPWSHTKHPTDHPQHDAVLDYYGRRLATCSSDKTIKIFEIEGDQHRLTETLKGQVLPASNPGAHTTPNTP